MSRFDLDAARAFVAGAELPEQPLGLESVPATPQIVFDQAQKQAVLVGSNVVSFDTGVEAEFREAISDSALLAQLAANKAVPNASDVIRWFEVYFQVLNNVGWVAQVIDNAKYEVKFDGMEVHEAILDVVKIFLGPAPAALALVVQTLDSLKKMQADSPLITLFERNSQKAELSRFQFTYIRQEPDGGLSGEAMAFTLSAEQTITQVLFFKLSKARSKMERRLGTLSINRAALSGLRLQVRARVMPFMSDFVAQLDI